MWCGCSTKAKWLSDVIFIRTQTSASLPIPLSSQPDPLHPAGQVHVWLALQRESSRLDCQFPNVRGSYWPLTQHGMPKRISYTPVYYLLRWVSCPERMGEWNFIFWWLERENTPTSLSNTHITLNDIIVWHHSDVTVARDSQRCIHW